MKILYTGFVLTVAATILFIYGCTPLLSRPVQVTEPARWQMFPDTQIPLNSGAKIYWNQYGIPFVHSDSDEAAAFALGAAHTHLRWGQLEILKRIVQGRLSEMVGPFTTDIDHTLRVLDLAKASDQIIAGMDPETRRWADAFVSGINWYMQNSTERPHEFTVLALDDEPWHLKDLIGISRLAGADLSWMIYAAFLRLPDNDERKELWSQLLNLSHGSPSSFEPTSPRDLEYFTSHLSRSGSNSLVLAKERTATPSALIANDPHLGISIPNFWLIAGVKSPSYHCVGLMIPGLPFFALGRNMDIAWGGTNMRAISSHLFELGDEEAVTEREETVKVRWWLDRSISIADSKLGPLVNEAPLLESNRKLALQWVGHRGDSDEVSAFLAANRARNFPEFRQAFEKYSVSAQNMLYADRSGDIGMVLAYRQPRLSHREHYRTLIKPADAASSRVISSTQLPFIFNPNEHFIASANNKPVETEIPLAYSYAAPDRFRRIREIVQGKKLLGISDLKALQQDVFSESSYQLAQHLTRSLLEPTELSASQSAVWQAVTSWDGYYRSNSRGAAAYEILLTSVVPKLLERFSDQAEVQTLLKRGSYWMSIVQDELESLSSEELQALVKRALQDAGEIFSAATTWGDLHRQVIQHPLGYLPLIGKRYQVAEFGAAGGNNTLLKTGHPLTNEKHRVTYGAQSRHISDLSDPDENYFVLLGGQDGWLFSPNTADQIELWRKGRYIQVPLTLKRIKREFKRVVNLVPTTTATAAATIPATRGTSEATAASVSPSLK